MNVGMRGVVLLVASLAVAFLVTGCGGADRRDYVARNETILDTLPVFPGASRSHEFSTPEYSGGELADPSGYTTTRIYRVPHGTRGAAVLRFYESRLHRRGWHSAVEGGTSRQVRRSIADFTRGGARVAVNTIFLRLEHARPIDWIYEIEVDHRAGAGG